MKKLELFAACPLYMEDLLEEEVLKLGGEITKRSPGGLQFLGTLPQVYDFSLNTRIGSHLLLLLHEFSSEKDLFTDLYEETVRFHWQDFMDEKGTFACRASSRKSSINTKLASLKLKDGIADYWRNLTGKRPDVDRENPDVRLQVHFDDYHHGRIYLDLSGQSLSNRGYRLDGARAAMRENTAAALIKRSSWKELSSQGSVFLDPMCGSGTLLIEAALEAADLPSNLFRSHFAFMTWKGHDQDLWEDMVDKAEKKWTEGLKSIPLIIGYDIDKHAVTAAIQNIKRLGLEKYIHVEKKDLHDFKMTESLRSAPSGLLLTNPPYGVRIGEKNTLFSLYRSLGDLCRQEEMKGWKMSVISDDRALIKAIGLRSNRENKIMNGALSCIISHYDLYGGEQLKIPEKKKKELEEIEFSQEGEQFRNRLKKRHKHLKKWLKREGVVSYRLYDADLPNFNFAIDVYEGKWVHMQEYRPPSQVDSKKAEDRSREAVKIVCHALDIPRNQVFLKERRRQKGSDQYTSLSKQGEKYLIREWNQRIWVNFTDYLDTGIFLDHRNIRKYLLENSEKKNILNLFSYTCTASLMAAAGKAEKVVSVDSSKTYLTWGKENFKLNALNSPKMIFEQSDSFQYLRNSKDYFDTIFLDPPTFSNSKGKRPDFDVQTDHKTLIHLCMKRLKKDGLLIFSNNYRNFILHEEIKKEYKTTEESSWTVSEDFKKEKYGHRCWFIRHNGG